MEAALGAAQDRAGPSSLSLAAGVLWLTGQPDAARAATERALRDNPAHVAASLARGWIDATAGMHSC